MSVGTFNPEQAVSVTEKAQKHFENQIAHSNDNAVRLSIKESGCTGYMYVVDLVSASTDSDIILNLENGVTLYVDKEALPVVQGTIIDMVQEGVNNVLSFNNPNVAEQCGCGESFNIK